MPWLLAFWPLALWPPAALAHAHLEQAEPADGATLSASPPQFTLRFSQAAQLTALSLQKQGQARPQKLAPLPAAAGVQLQVAAPVLDPGSYELRYRVVSADGHVMAGSVHFTVAAR
jgi:methionine-rich copper-binding protein CopC